MEQQPQPPLRFPSYGHGFDVDQSIHSGLPHHPHPHTWIIFATSHFILHTIRFLTRIIFYLLIRVLFPFHQIFLELQHSPLLLHITQHNSCTIDPQCLHQNLIMKAITTITNILLMILFHLHLCLIITLHEDFNNKYEDHIVAFLPINNLLPIVQLFIFFYIL